jgi:ABC-type antimicrobial peptide transport system permease subunit
MALGAQRRLVCRLILQEAGTLIAGGLAIGLVCSIGAAALLRGLLFATHFWDLPTLLAVTVLLSASALLASYFPARRAASVNPLDALRME